MNMTHQQNKRCYNCGKELNKTNSTREHIPAQALFQGYPNSYKSNRITVPACSECNNRFSSIDEDFRNIIGSCTNIQQNRDLTNNAVLSILRKQNPIVLLNDGSFGVEFKESVFDEFHKKNFKGLFYYQYGKVLPDTFRLLVNADETDCSELTRIIIAYLRVGFEWKCSGHPDIFSYCLQPVRENLDVETNKKNDLSPTDSDKLFACAMKYNKTHVAIVYAIKKR